MALRKLKSRGETAIAADLEAATETMQRHVERQLAKARLQSKGGHTSALARTTIDRVVNVARKTPDGIRLAWSVDVPDGLRVAIHPEDLSEAVGGLVENAARHARTRVAISAGRRDGDTLLYIADDGPGIPEDLQTEALVRGSRMDETRPGSGLGLAIVADIADAWGGSIGFEREEDMFIAVLQLKSAAAA